jgi:hypothetical protein
MTGTGSDNDAAGRSLFHEVTGRSAPDQWPGLTETSRQSWRLRATGDFGFIPSDAVPRKVNQKVVLPPPAPELPARVITPDDTIWGSVMPGGAKQVAKLAGEHGWDVAVSYCKGPWTMQTQHDDDDGDDVLTKHAQADSVVVRGRRGDRSFAAMWLRKPWTKVGQQPASSQGAGGYQLEFAQLRPAPNRLTGGSGGTKLDVKTGKWKPIPTDVKVRVNGQVKVEELKRFIRGEEI